MKTFQEFIFICEKLNKTHDENSQSKIWNYFIANPDNQVVRDLLIRKDYKGAEEEIKKQVDAAKNDPEHPLNFGNAGEDEFSKESGRQTEDEEPYNNFLDDSISGLLALSKEKKIRKSIERGLPSRVAGKSQAELSKRFSRDGGTDKTSKGDLEIFDPNNDKFRVGVSMKKGKGAQLASAESGELKGMVSSAAREYVKKFHSDKSKEEREKIEQEIMGGIEIVAQNQIDMKTADRDTQKNLKTASQEVLDGLRRDYPQLTRLINQVATSGKGKFKSQQGVADVVLTGKEGDVEASAIPSVKQKSSSLRAALPKGRSKTTGISRPGNTKIDYKPEKEAKSNQQQPQQGPKSFQQFNREVRMSELRAKGVGSERDAKIEAEKAAIEQERKERQELERKARYELRKSEKQVAQADRELEDANDEMQDASVPIDPDTKKPVLRQFIKNIEGHIAADPTSRTSRVNLQRRTRAELRLSNAQTNRDNAAATHDTNVQQVQAVQAPASQEQPQQQTQPPTPQQQTQPPTPQEQPAPVPAPQEQPAPVPVPQEQPAPVPAPVEQPPASQEPQQEKPEDKKPKKGLQGLLKRMDTAATRNNLEQ
jgi:hypothetical protein